MSNENKQNDERAAIEAFWKGVAEMDPNEEMDAEEIASAAFSAGVSFARATQQATTGERPLFSTDRCDDTVYEHGQSIGLFDIPKETANAICAGITAITGARVDWHYIAGRVHMKALAAPAARDVLAERARQVNVEGWTPAHDDDQHEEGELAAAAACYAVSYEPQLLSYLWPWDLDWWKPTTPRRNLIKAGALILAEIERIDRAGGDSQ